MIEPSATDVLRNIEFTLDTVIRPTLTGKAEQSAAASISHLLRHVCLRIEQEGQILFDDIASLRGLLGGLQEYFNTVGEAVVARTMARALVQAPEVAGRYPALADVAATAGGLRAALHAGLQQLQEMRAVRGGEAAYQTQRESIRDYLAGQLRRESALIDPAFTGRGPRR